MKSSNKTLLIGVLTLLIVITLFVIALRVNVSTEFHVNVTSKMPTSFKQMLTASGSEEKHANVNGNANLNVIAPKTYDFSDFDAVNIAGDFTVTIKPSDKSQIIFPGNLGDMQDVEMYVSGNTLTVKDERRHIDMTILTKNLKSISTHGNIKIMAENINEDSLSVNAAGSGDYILSGKVQKLNVDFAGNNSFSAKDLQADEVKLDFSGNNDITVYAGKSLHINGFGSSEVTYYGNPKDVKNSVAGNIDIKRME